MLDIVKKINNNYRIVKRDFRSIAHETNTDRDDVLKTLGNGLCIADIGSMYFIQRRVYCLKNLFKSIKSFFIPVWEDISYYDYGFDKYEDAQRCFFKVVNMDMNLSVDIVVPYNLIEEEADK